MVSFQKQFNKAMNTFTYYNTREYVYKNDKFKQLTVNMNEKDKEIFYCDFEKVMIHYYKLLQHKY